MVASFNGFFSFLQSLLAFIIILVPLVVFHELGHFIFAKIFRVKAQIFSVGFGPKLWSRQKGETEFRISMIPMGGYVKLLGEDRDTELSEEEARRSLHRQEPWKRFFIFFGGPLFNFILAVFIFMVILLIGEPQISSVIGRVVRYSAAEKIGFQSGDRVLSVNQKPLKKFEEILIIVNQNPDKKVDFEVIHPGQQKSVHLEVQISSQSGFSLYGESTRVGEISGILPMPRSTVVGVSDPKSSVALHGIETGDQVVELDQHPVFHWEEMEKIYSGVLPGSTFKVQVKSPKVAQIKLFLLTKPQRASNLGDDFGLHSSELFVEKTIAKSPAEGSGILPGDRLVSVGKQKVESFFELKDAVQKSGEKEGKVLLTWEHQGKMVSKPMVPTATSMRDPILNKTTQFTVGIIPKLILSEPETFVERIWNPFKLVYTATDRMVSFSWRNLISLRKMLTGEVSVGTIGGPIMIGKIAGESLARGLIVFLNNMAIFSIGLGVLNILPVPVLDGGHLMLLGIEMVRGKPLTLRQMEVIQSVGLILILALMGIAFHNDIARLFYS